MKRAPLLLCATIAVATWSGCAHHHQAHTRPVPAPVVVTRGGPPSHAPAHGYRHKHHHHGVDLVFDARLGVYVVVGSEGIYFHRERFYRVVNGVWQVSLHVDRGFTHVHPAKLPKAFAKGSMRPKRHEQHPAKHPY